MYKFMDQNNTLKITQDISTSDASNNDKNNNTPYFKKQLQPEHMGVNNSIG